MAGNWHPTTPCWDPLDPDQETERCRATKARARKLCDPIGRQSTWRAASIRCALCGVCGVLGHQYDPNGIFGCNDYVSGVLQ